MITRKVQQIKESLHVVIPRQLCHMMDIEKGMDMQIVYRNGIIEMTPAPANRQVYTGDGAVTQPLEAAQ